MASPPVLVSIEQARGHLRLGDVGSEEDQQVLEYLTLAEDIVQEYLGDQWDDTWDEDTVPGSVTADILRTLADLWRHRGDEVPDANADANSSARVRFRHLYPRKGPTVA